MPQICEQNGKKPFHIGSATPRCDGVKGRFDLYAYLSHANRPEVARNVVVTLFRSDPGMFLGLNEGID